MLVMPILALFDSVKPILSGADSTNLEQPRHAKPSFLFSAPV